MLSAAWGKPNSSSQANRDPDLITRSLGKVASGSLQVLRADRVSVTVACECSRALEVTQAFLHVSFPSIHGERLLSPMVQKFSIPQGRLIRRYLVELQLCTFVVGRYDLAGIDLLVTLPFDPAPTLRVL